MDIRLNDVLEMKKTHPCGEKRWQVLRTGMDFRLRCLRRSRLIEVPWEARRWQQAPACGKTPVPVAVFRGAIRTEFSYCQS